MTTSTSRIARAAGSVPRSCRNGWNGTHEPGSGADPAHARVLDRLVRVEQQAAGRSDVGRGSLGGERVQRVCAREGIVVQEDEDVAARDLRACVVAAAEVAVLLQPHDRRAGLPGVEQRAGVVRGGVVDEHELDVGAEPRPELALERGEEALGQRALPVQDRDDGGDHGDSPVIGTP